MICGYKSNIYSQILLTFLNIYGTNTTKKSCVGSDIFIFQCKCVVMFNMLLIYFHLLLEGDNFFKILYA